MKLMRSLIQKGWTSAVGLLLMLPFIVLLIILGQMVTAFWVTPEIIRLWSQTDRTAAYIGSSLILTLYLLLGSSIITFIYFWLLTKHKLKTKKRYGITAGLLLTLPILTLYIFTHTNTRETEGIIAAFIAILLLYALWGTTLHFTYRYLHNLQNFDEQPYLLLESSNPTRRQFLKRLTSTSLATTLTLSGLGQWLIRQRERERQRLLPHNNLPDTLTAQIFPMTLNSTFPEMNRNRYQPTKHPFGVCFSGGGFRAYSAGLGQLRALYHLGLLETIGAISCVSGGALMGALFTYAASNIDDATLLGPVIDPTALTLAQLSKIDPQNMAAPLLNFTDSQITRTLIELEEIMMLTGQLDPDKVYARILNQLFLSPFNLDDVGRFFSLDVNAVQAIIRRNPSLTVDDFYITRPNRPYYIAGMTHVFPVGLNPTVRNFECTPLYIGTPQLFPNEGINGTNFGGGYIESFAFDTRQGALPDANNLITVPTPKPPFLLSDMIGSTSAAPGAILDKMGQPDLMPSFYYWPIHKAQATTANEYSFIDGNFIENLGIVPLLRRQYPTILVFVNSGFPIGLEGTDPFSTLDFGIGRLFGFVPPNDTFNTKNTQIFPKAQFQALADGLKEAKRKQSLAVFVDSYQIVQPNIFDIPPYPNNKDVTVVWFYNELYQPWLDKLPLETKTAMADPAYNLAKFPHYETTFHNKTKANIPELFYLSPEQINLLSYMWTYALMDGAKELLNTLHQQQ